MKLENQVVSLELAQKMKELGFWQDSLFYWVDNEESEWMLCLNWKNEKSGDPIICVDRELKEEEDGGFYPAYTVAELGEMLPPLYETYRVFDNNKITFECCPPDNLSNRGYEFFQSKTESDARAKMLIYLKENSLI